MTPKESDNSVDQNSMSSVSGTDPLSNVAGLAQELLVAKQNQQSAVNTSSSGTTAGLAAKLNSLYGSTGINQASTTNNALGQMANMLGIDSTTLASELQGKNAGEVSKMIQEQMMLNTMTSDASSSTSNDTLGSLDGLASTNSSDTTTPNIQNLLQGLQGSGNLYDSQL